MDLHDSLTASHGVVVHVGVEKGKAPRNKRFHLAGVKLITHADFERSGNDSDVFPAGVEVRINAETIGHLQTNGEVAGGSGGVAFEHRELRARAHDRRGRSPRNGIRSESVGFVRSMVCGCADWPRRPSERTGQSECKQKESFHD